MSAVQGAPLAGGGGSGVRPVADACPAYRSPRWPVRPLPDGGFHENLRNFILTVVDDFVALGVIAVAYSHRVTLPALLVGLGIFGVMLLVRAGGVRRGTVYALLAVPTWVAFLESGVDPIVVGLAMGLLTHAYVSPGGAVRAPSVAGVRIRRPCPLPEFLHHLGQWADTRTPDEARPTGRRRERCRS